MTKKRDVRRDRAGTGPDPEESRRRLVSIEDLDDYRIAKGEPDVRGWDVCTLNGRELGAVEDLLIDPNRGEVVMLEVALRNDGVHTEVPIRSVQLDRNRKVVVVDSGEVDAGPRHEVRTRDRMSEGEREDMRSAYRSSREGTHGTVVEHEADADTAGTEERVVERRPMVEEVVVRRRPVEE
jgi:sporulation protein YlmC with PRC-barrel domain